MMHPSSQAIELPPRQAKPLWDVGAWPQTSPGPRATQRLCDLTAIATAAAFAVPVGELIAASRRTPYIAFARQNAMYLAHVTFGLNYAEVGRAFGRDRTTAAYACRLIEERRDDPAIDAVLGSLENACGALRRRLIAPVQQ
jgi:Bacterial dnaA protein helix-turn-helix